MNCLNLGRGYDAKEIDSSETDSIKLFYIRDFLKV